MAYDKQTVVDGETISSNWGNHIEQGIEDVDNALTSHAGSNTAHNLASKLDKSGGVMTGVLTAQNNTSYTTAQVRNITLSTLDPSGGGNGDIWIKYKP